ncbi:hypothetical protein CLAIMM_09593 [Cladophialophora immunda]|nr:hypothetical protein CLAIMM_09593 [Cladophialophora immunda]
MQSNSIPRNMPTDQLAGPKYQMQQYLATLPCEEPYRPGSGTRHRLANLISNVDRHIAQFASGPATAASSRAGYQPLITDPQSCPYGHDWLPDMRR